MNSVILWIGGLLVVALCLLFAVPQVIDWNAFRGVFEEEASRVLGRDVRVGGRVNLRLLPAPYVRFEKVRISDADATLGESFFRTESFTLWLSLAPLVRGVVEAREVELDRPVLRLAIDADGRGNWQSLRLARGALPFVPNDVVLQQLRIRNGEVSLRTSDGAPPVVLGGIDGELSADTLDGPYRFRGNVQLDGVVHELRLATAVPEAGGRVRFRAATRTPSNNASFTLDGSLSGLTPLAKIEGALTGRLPVPSVTRAAGKAPATGTAASADNAFDVKAQLSGDLDKISLQDISLAFEQGGTPQLISGQVAATWRGNARVEARLASRWLDLDHIVGARAASPAEAARELVERLANMVPSQGTTLATLDADQINLGGEPVSGVRLAIARVGGVTSIGELKAALPGNARLDLRGTLGKGLDPRAFEGEVVLHGSSYRRFAAWAGRGAHPETAGTEAAAAPIGDDGAFSLVSALRLVPGRVDLTGATLELAGAQVQGDLAWQRDGARLLELSAEGTTVDVSALAPGLLDMLGQRNPDPAAASPGTGPAATGTPLAGISAAARRIADNVGALRLKLRARELTDGTRTVRDVEADLAVAADTLQITGLRLTTVDGVGVDMQGDLKGLGARPTGRLRGWLSAAGEAAVSALAAQLSGPGLDDLRRRASHIGRVDLGFDARIADGGSDRVSIRADGMLDDGRLGVTLMLAGGLERWRSAPIDLALTFDSPDLPGLLNRMGGAKPPSPSAPVTGTPPAGTGGTLVLKAAGDSATTLSSFAQIDLDGVGIAYSGRSGLAEDGTLDLAGEMSVIAGDAADLVALAGFASRPQLQDVGVEGTFAVSRSAGNTRLDVRALTVGASRISGHVLVGQAGGRLMLDGKLSASTASVPALLGPLLGGPARTAAAETAAVADRAWPQIPFALDLLDAIGGRLAITAPELELAPGLGVSDAGLVVELEPQRVTLRDISGSALGGRLAAKATIERAAAGAGGPAVTVTGTLAGGRLERLLASPGQSKLGTATITLELEGRGSSPLAVVQSIAGRGEIALDDARARGLAVAGLDKMAESLIEGTADVTRETVVRGVAEQLATGELAIGSRKLPITVADGVVKVGALQLDSAAASVRNLTTVTLDSLKVDSNWEIAPRGTSTARRAGTATKAPLPPLSVVYSGTLAALPGIAPRLGVDALERELGVRKMERDVERLEELRRRDQERARAEAERLRQLDGSATGPGAGEPVPPRVIQAPFPINPPRPAPPPPAAEPRRQGASVPAPVGD